LFPRTTRGWFEAALFVLALVLALAGGFGAAGETVANTLYFAAWCAALVLLFSLGLRLPLHLRGRFARLTAAASWSAPSRSACSPTSRSIGMTRISTSR
jgi:hypothetical protein